MQGVNPRYAVGDKIWFAHYSLETLCQENIPGIILSIDESRFRGHCTIEVEDGWPYDVYRDDIYEIEVWYPGGGRRVRKWASERRIIGTRSEQPGACGSTTGAGGITGA